MINIAAIALLLSSLAAAGVWSPAPPNPPADPHLVREGHRVIVVEYERHVPLESPPTPPPTTHNIIEETKDRFQEATNLLPNVGQGISMPEPQYAAAVEKPAHSAKEVICDAYGSCKEKISNAFNKGKDKISRKASDIEEKASDIKESAKEAVESTMRKASAIEEGAKDAVKRKMESANDAVRSTVENVSRAAEGAADSIHRNLSDIASRAKDAALDAANRFGAATEAARAAASVGHMLAFATAYGTCVWVTFVSSHVLAAALPRQQFGVVQSKIYPVYFRALAYSTAAACLCHFFAQKRLAGVERVQAYNLMAALGLVLANMLYLEPKATKVMFERMKMEKEEGRGRDIADVLGEPVVTATTATAATTQSATTIGVTKTTVTVDQEAVKSRVAKLNKKLKKLNTYSSFLNILTLMSLTWHLVHLSRRLQMVCR